MSNSLRCDECGRELQANAPQGLCPRCLFAMAVCLGGTDVDTVASGHHPTPATRLRYFGDYELIEEIARGGMGIVYKASQVTLNRTVAVKVLLFGQFSSDTFVRRFRTEAQAAASLRHPNIVAIHEIGEHEGQHYFSMDYIEGQSLADLVRDEPLPLGLAVAHLITIAEAIEYAHQQGVLHRDLKPSNILVDEDGQPHVTDFGLAKRLGLDSQITLPGQLLGSPNYMPPEQVEPKHGRIGVHSDVYSLGAILYHLLTGRPPFVGQTLEETLLQVLNTEPTPLRKLNAKVPLDLETICLKCISKTPQHRYSTAGSLAADLERWRKREPILARPISSLGKVWLWSRRRPAFALLAVSVLLLAAVAMVSFNAASRIKDAGRISSNPQRSHALSPEPTREELWDSYLAQARVIRSSGQVGRRFDALNLLAKAAAIRVTPELRNEASACMALSDLRLIKRLRQVRGIEGIRLNPAMTEYAVLQQSGAVRIYSSSEFRELRRLPAQDGTERRLQSFSPNGRLLAVSGDASFLRIWDVHSFAVALTCWASESADSVAFSPGDQRVAIINPQSQVTVYDLASGRSQPLNSQIKAGAVAYNPAGTLLAVARADEPALLILDSLTGERRMKLNFKDTVRTLAWHPGGLMLATIHNQDTNYMVHVWETKSGNEVRTLLGHLGNITAVMFSGTGRYVFTSGLDGTIIWNFSDGERLVTLPGISTTWASTADDKNFARWNDTSSELEIYDFVSGTERQTASPDGYQ